MMKSNLNKVLVLDLPSEPGDCQQEGCSRVTALESDAETLILTGKTETNASAASVMFSVLPAANHIERESSALGNAGHQDSPVTRSASYSPVPRSHNN